MSLTIQLKNAASSVVRRIKDPVKKNWSVIGSFHNENDGAIYLTLQRERKKSGSESVLLPAQDIWDSWSKPHDKNETDRPVSAKILAEAGIEGAGKIAMSAHDALDKNVNKELTRQGEENQLRALEMIAEMSNE